jgi:predicted enzyme related to lactoylglutathione lyase
MEPDKTIGAVGWTDLTVPDADAIRDFYKNVIGWKTMDVAMGDYNDYCMLSPDDNAVRTGICHHRGSNEGIPPVWMLYINVADLDKCIEEVKKGGGAIVHGPRKMGDKARFCVIRDPAGAYCGLYDHGSP